MKSNDNDIFGGFFDFNGDGKNDIGEEWIAYQIMEECMKEDGDEEADEYSIFDTESACTAYDETAPSSSPLPLPEIHTKEELKTQCGKRQTDIICTVLAVLITLFPVCAVLWATYASYDPDNSASALLIVIFTLVGIFVGSTVIYVGCKEISAAADEIEELKNIYRRNYSDNH